MKIKINNINELKSEIARLTKLKEEQEAYLDNQYTLLKNKVEAPTRILGSVTSSIPGIGLLKNLFSSTKSVNTNTSVGSDWVNRSIRLVVPMLLNTTVLRHSGWLKKALVLLLSQTAAKNVTEATISNLVSKVANFVRPSKKKVYPKEDSFNKSDFNDEQILGI